MSDLNLKSAECRQDEKRSKKIIVEERTRRIFFSSSHWFDQDSNFINIILIENKN